MTELLKQKIDLKTTKQLCVLLCHEKVHVYQKKYKEDIKYDKFGNWVKKSFFKILKNKIINEIY